MLLEQYTYSTYMWVLVAVLIEWSIVRTTCILSASCLPLDLLLCWYTGIHCVHINIIFIHSRRHLCMRSKSIKWSISNSVYFPPFPTHVRAHTYKCAMILVKNIFLSFNSLGHQQKHSKKQFTSQLQNYTTTWNATKKCVTFYVLVLAVWN